MNLLKEMLSGFEVGKDHMIIPDIIDAHFHVIDISIDDQSENFITAIEYYNFLNSTNQTTSTSNINKYGKTWSGCNALLGNGWRLSFSGLCVGDSLM